MKLIEFTDFNIKITDEALLVKPIRKLFNKDKSKNKEAFLTQMSILYFYADPRSGYNYLTDEKERPPPKGNAANQTVNPPHATQGHQPFLGISAHRTEAPAAAFPVV